MNRKCKDKHFFREPFFPKHEENLMRDEGNVVAARDHYLKTKTVNLRFLLKNRFSWMNSFINKDGVGIEIGAGTGISKEFIYNQSYKITDFSNNPWLDLTNVDALATPFSNNEFDFIICNNMIHHVPYPLRFFAEMNRILKNGGVLLIQEVNASFFMRMLLRFMKHEGYSFDVDIWNPDEVCTDINDLWSANCAIPNLLFDDEKDFESKVNYLKIVKKSYSEFFNFINSGGVIAKTIYIPLPYFFLEFLKKVDDLLASHFPQMFALQRQIVLKKI